MVTIESVLTLIKEHLPFGSDLQAEVREDSLLAELGIDSLHLINMLLKLQREYSMDIESMTENGMPNTVSDLVALVAHGVATEKPSPEN